MTRAAVVILAVLACARAVAALGDYEVPFSAFPAYGVPRGEFPSYYERATLAWYNMVRAAPTAYARDYVIPLMQQGDNSGSNVFSSSSMPAVPPAPWNLNLNRAARAHSADVLAHCPTSLTHNDCNGTDTWTRVAKFYTSTAGTGEIFAPMSFHGFDAIHWPAWSIAAWVCDGTSGMSWGSDGSQFNLNNCPEDGPSAGHRSNIMTMGGEVGCGVAISGSTMISTCDTSTQQSSYSNSQTQVASGAHVTDVLHKGKFYFIASSASAVPSASVIVDGRRIAMKPYAGTTTYTTDPVPFTSTERCHSYYFQFSSTRFPAQGSYKTFGIGSCAEDYEPGTVPATSSSSAHPPHVVESSSSSRGHGSSTHAVSEHSSSTRAVSEHSSAPTTRILSRSTVSGAVAVAATLVWAPLLVAAC
eukprot:m51a1_g10900 hypothetical protein (415) ;mRNA; f:32733-34537